MRHGKKFPHLGRKTAHRKYMLANMACSLIEHKSINTTLAKAKALKLFIEPIITKSKNDSTHNRRIAFRYLRDKNELFREISVKIGDRPGGYTRVIKLGNRLGDNADMALIELVDYNEIYSTNKPDKKRRRRRRKSSQNLVQTKPENQESLTENDVDEKIEETAVDVKKEVPVAEEAPAAEEAPSEDSKENEDDKKTE